MFGGFFGDAGNPSSPSSPSQPQAGGGAPDATYPTAPEPQARPKRKAAFSNVYSMNIQPPLPPPVQQPVQQPPGPNQGVLPTGLSNLGGPTVAHPPFSGVNALHNTGIFNLTGIRPSDIDKILESDPRLPDTPTRTNAHTVAELQNIVNTTTTDAELLDVFRSRVNSASRGRAVEQRKGELRASVQPWINAGLSYTGPKRPGLFLPDGTRNPDRPARGAGGGPQVPPSDAGNRPSDPAKGPTGTKAPRPAGTGRVSSSGIKKILSSTTKKSSSKRPGKSPSKGSGTSPLSQPPLTAADIQQAVPGAPAGTGSIDADPPQQTTSGTDGTGWRCRDDLFEAQSMDAAGTTWASSSDDVHALPRLASTIDYNTDNW